jgi:lipopolysaccharide export system protein LptC
MKNKISLLIILTLLAVIVLAFSACGETPQGTDTGVGEEDIPTEYVIENADGFEIDVETNKIYKTVSNSMENGESDRETLTFLS